MPITTTTDGLADLERAVRDLVKNQVLIGIAAENAARPPGDGEKDPPNNATIGYWMEYGVPEANIPARPHLLPGIAKVQDKIEARLRKAGQEALSGNREGVENGLIAVGLIGQAAVRNEITSGTFAPLSARTLAKRKARGITRDKPLIDTGKLREAYSYVIRRKGS